MEERVSNLERDYDAFIADISAQYTQHSRLLHQLVRDTYETRLRVAAIEARQNGVDEKLDEMREDITTMKGDIFGIKGDIFGIKDDIFGIKDNIKQILLLLGQREE